MSRSVLVIDTPKTCADCIMLCVKYCEYQCLANDKLIKKATGKPDWCPLKPLPERKEYIVPIDNVESQKDIIAVGWNACIDEITGGGDSDD